MRWIVKIVLMFAVLWFADDVVHAADLRVPQRAIAGSETALTATASGTLYVFGPGTAMKKDVKAGDEVRIPLKRAGTYIAVLNGESSTFAVGAGAPSDIAFLARPSRVPADKPGVISGTVFLFDNNRNLTTAPLPVKFDLAVEGGKPESRQVQSKNGVAWVKLNSGRKAGPAQFVATVGSTSVKRVVQETASDPCNLRMKVQPSKNGVTVETDTVKDCAGNPVPDGTIVTFTAMGPMGRSTIDARVKKGIAKADLPPMQNATFSVASGVVVGNEIHWGGGM
jgi:hypothetical protein